jgi:hypothetical protein
MFLSRTISATFKNLELTPAGKDFIEGLWMVDVTFMPDAEEGHVALTTLGTLEIDLEGYDDRPCRIIVPKRFADRLRAEGVPFTDWPDQSTDCQGHTDG